MAERRFRVEGRADRSTYLPAQWFPVNSTATTAYVEQHCLEHGDEWRAGKYRLFELKPIEVKFKTIVDLQEID